MPGRDSVGVVTRPNVGLPDWTRAEVTETGRASAVVVTASGSTNTYGSWVQLIASTSADSGHLTIGVDIGFSAGTDVANVVSIGFGAASSEVEQFYFIAHSWGISSRTSGPGPTVPIWIPNGTRISARTQSNVASRTLEIHAIARKATPGVRYPRTIDSLGVTLASSTGVTMTTTDAWNQVTAATSRAYMGGVIMYASHSTSKVSATPLISAGYGGAGAEVAWAGLYAADNSSSEQTGTAVGEFFRPQQAHIPAGARLAVKSSIGASYREASLLMFPVT